MKVYLVMTSHYDGLDGPYHWTDAIFVTKEKAEERVKENESNPHQKIESWWEEFELEE